MNLLLDNGSRGQVYPRSEWGKLLRVDRCDEFPLPATRESGALLGLTGLDCVEIWPDNSTGSWVISYPAAAPTLNENCVRGHVLLSVNTAAGGKLGAFINAKRVVDKDPYYVTGTA